jgi:dihydroorotate dehydrogenase electron transfer subunit
MLKALQKNISPEKTAFISLEERMGCGVGACLACVCDLSEPIPDAKAYVRVCTEGPVFPLNSVKL